MTTNRGAYPRDRRSISSLGEFREVRLDADLSGRTLRYFDQARARERGGVDQESDSLQLRRGSDQQFDEFLLHIGHDVGRSGDHAAGTRETSFSL